MEGTPSLRADRPRPKNVRAGTAWLAAVLCAVAAPVDTLARDVTLRFLPPADSEVSSYLVYAKDLDSRVEAEIDVGFVAPDADGVARTTVLLDDAITYSVQMTASNDYGTSPRSNEIVIQAAAPLCDPVLCDDGNPCTADWCDAAGCASAPVQDGTHCDDGYVDTVDDQCVQGICEGLILTCRTDDECDDGNPCNGSETCGGPAGCLEGTPLYCGEPTACTAPGCTPEGECFTEVIPDGTPCDDGLADTAGDACLAGTCQGVVFDPTPGLVLAEISPEVVFPGTQALEFRGAGFMPGAVIYFENGAGRPPKVKGLRFVNDGLLSATVDVGGGGPPRAQYFDVRVELPDGRSAVLPQVLRIDR